MAEELVPEKIPKQHSREYLEEALNAARKLLPDWMFAMLHDMAFPRSGAKARGNKRKAEAAAKMLGGAVEIDKIAKADLPSYWEAFIDLGLAPPQKFTERVVRDHGKSAPDVTAETVMIELHKNAEIKPPPFTCEVLAPMDTGDMVVALGDDVAVLPVAEGVTVEGGDLVDVVLGTIVAKSKRMFPDDGDSIAQLEKDQELIAKMATRIDPTGPDNARVVFVTAAPNELEVARGEALVGQDGVTFQKLYLDPLGLTKSDVALAFIAPHWIPDQVDVSKVAPWLKRLATSTGHFGKNHGGHIVVALGKVAKEALGARAAVSLPHPSAVRKRGDAGEVERKLKRIAKFLDAKGIPTDTSGKVGNAPSQERSSITLTDANGEQRGSAHIVSKSAGEKQIVYGVVLDPYIVDTHGDWIPPSEIEQTAHDYLETSRVIGLEHREKATAKLVESWVIEYPSPADREAAFLGLPHRAFKRKFGDDTVCSGTWMIGVQLSDELWTQYQAGEITGLSIGGFSQKLPTNTSAMPDVTFIDQT